MRKHIETQPYSPRHQDTQKIREDSTENKTLEPPPLPEEANKPKEKKVLALHKFDITPDTLQDILHHSAELTMAYQKWASQFDGKKPQRLGTIKKTAEFIDWAQKNTTIDFDALLPEKKKAEKKVKELKAVGEKTNFLPVSFTMNKEIRPILKEWKDIRQKEGNVFTKEEATDFLQWAIKEKEIDISAKTHSLLTESLEQLIAAEYLGDPLEEMREKEREASKQEEDNIRKQIHDTIAFEKDGRRHIEHQQIVDEINDALAKHKNELYQHYGIIFDERDEPATKADEQKIQKYLAIANEDSRTVERASFFGKIKRGLSDLFTSQKTKIQAKQFERDYDDYRRILSELEQYPDPDRMKTTGGGIRRSVLRNTGDESTGMGRIETQKYTPNR